MKARTTNTNPPRLHGSSPWDQIDFLRVIAPGVVSVSTPSHGGLWISPELEATIPADCQAIARQYAPAGWYEEDCDCLIPIALLEGFDPKHVAVARNYAMKNARFAPIARELDRRHITIAA